MTPEFTSTETQQNNFTLSFLRWLDLNFTRDREDQYCPITEVPSRKARLPLYTAEELLIQFRKEQVPVLPTASDLKATESIFTITEHLFSHLTQSSKRTFVLLKGLNQILNLPTLSQDAKDIVKQTLDNC